DRRQVLGELRVSIARPARRIGLAVAAGVVGDRPIAAPGKGVRAVDDVAARRGEAVREEDRWPLPHLLASQGVIAAPDLEMRRLHYRIAATARSRAATVSKLRP